MLQEAVSSSDKWRKTDRNKKGWKHQGTAWENLGTPHRMHIKFNWVNTVWNEENVIIQV